MIIKELVHFTSYSKEILYVPTCIDSQVFTTAKLKTCEQHWEYRIYRIISGVFNLAVWRIIFNPPNLNNAVSGL